MRCIRALTIGFSLLGAATAARAVDGMIDPDLLAAYGGKDFVSIATGDRQPLRRAPAVASVITREDLIATGARDLDQALDGVPGLHVSRSFLMSNPIYSFRGIHSQYNSQVLLLINGIPMTSVFVGDRGNMWGGMPVDNVERIEVIRGAGSALYGADAFAGVINVITRSPKDWQGNEFGFRAGSFDTQDAWLNHASTLGPVSFGLYVSSSRTEGNDPTISYDYQTLIDQALSTNASLAPGEANNQQKGTDLAIDASMGNWQLRAALKERHDLGSGTGIGYALDPTGKGSSRRWTADLTWQSDDLVRDWEFSVQGTYLHMTDFSSFLLYPPGAFGGTFPQGMYGSPNKWERHAGVNAEAVFTGWFDHRLRFGAGYQVLDLYKVREVKNYYFVGVTPTPLPGGTATAGANDAFIKPHKRINRFMYVQDEWSLSRNWTLTAGVRHDNYSDFGHTTNPRLALVWDTGASVTAKLLYGRAFRAPSFVEQYNINNPIALGNPSVTPEKMETWEAAVSWQASQDLQVSANLFHYRIRDTLRFTPDGSAGTSTAQNTGAISGRGAELEFTWQALPAVGLSGYYAYQHARDEDTGQTTGNAPRQSAYLRADWAAGNDWHLTSALHWVADRAREPARAGQQADTREAVSDYTLLDISVCKERLWRDLALAFTVRNVADATAYEPSPSPGSVDDFPLPGRTVLLSGTVRF